MNETMMLTAAGLLSKWGFNDGALPDEVCDWLDANAPDVDYVAADGKAVLVRLGPGFDPARG